MTRDVGIRPIASLVASNGPILITVAEEESFVAPVRDRKWVDV